MIGCEGVDTLLENGVHVIVNIKILIPPKNIPDTTTPEGAAQVGEMLGTVFADYINDNDLIAGTYIGFIEQPNEVRNATVEISWHDGMD